MQKKQWIHKDIPEKDICCLSADAGISRLMAKVFLNRGINDIEYIKDFLNPRIEQLHNPFLLKDMDIAVERIIKAIQNKERTVIYGDYDVDGVVSTSVLYDFLLSLGACVDYYIPDRIDDGYGFSKNSVDKVAKMGASLVISVDCGVTAFDEVTYMNDCNMQIIITDHHECKATLPEAHAVINPCRPDCNYPFGKLAGVGVVFKLVHAICIKMQLGEQYLKYLDLVALGTVADVVPLIDENRIIVKYGLPAIEKSENIGLKALMSIAGLSGKPLGTYGVGFGLAPRINAAGRIGDAGRAVKLFTTNDKLQAYEIATTLDQENKYRQETEQEIIVQVVEYIEKNMEPEKERIIIADGAGWHHGIIGIVASKITERYHRPCIVISTENGFGKASGRSIEGFNMFKALTHCSNLLERFGGHELAAGLSLKTENISEFRKMLNAYCESIISFEDMIPCIKIDAYLQKEDMCLENVIELEHLSPYGHGNPGPVFAYRGFKIDDVRTVGENKHLKLRLEDKGFFIDAIGFNMGGIASTCATSDVISSVFTLEVNTWNNLRKVQLNLKDIMFDKDIVFNYPNEYNRDNK